MRRFVNWFVGMSAIILFMVANVASAADTLYPLSVAVSGEGTIYIADRNLPGIWELKDGKYTVRFQGSKKFRTPLNAVRCVAIDKSGKVLAGDSSTWEVFRFDEPDKPTPLSKGKIGIPMSIGVTSKGDLIVSDAQIHQVVRVPADGGDPVKVAEVPGPRGLCVDAKDRIWVISGVGSGKLMRIADDKLETVIEECGFEYPNQIFVDADDTAYVTDGYAKTIWKIPAGGKPEKWVSGEPFVNPVGLTKQGENLLVADPRANAIFQVDASGKITKL